MGDVPKLSYVEKVMFDGSIGGQPLISRFRISTSIHTARTQASAEGTTASQAILPAGHIVRLKSLLQDVIINFMSSEFRL